MKLSEAIREGSKLSKQAFGNLLRADGSGDRCALGAAYHAAGINMILTNGARFLTGEVYIPQDASSPFQIFPIFFKSVDLPCDCHSNNSGYNVFGAVPHLNDYHRWSREAIAEWVETVEDKLESIDIPPEQEPTPIDIGVEEVPDSIVNKEKVSA